MPREPETTRRYVVMSQGYWSFIVDTATGRYHSHGYDLMSDAYLEAERLNAEEARDREDITDGDYHQYIWGNYGAVDDE